MYLLSSSASLSRRRRASVKLLRGQVSKLWRHLRSFRTRNGDFSHNLWGNIRWTLMKNNRRVNCWPWRCIKRSKIWLKQKWYSNIEYKTESIIQSVCGSYTRNTTCACPGRQRHTSSTGLTCSAKVAVTVTPFTFPMRSGWGEDQQHWGTGLSLRNLGLW